MSIFKGSKRPKIPAAKVEKPVEEIETIQETAGEARRREKKKLSRGVSRRGTILSGIQAALKKRLGE